MLINKRTIMNKLRLDATGCIRVSLSEEIGARIASHSKVPDFIEDAIQELNEEYGPKNPDQKLFMLYKKEGYIYSASTVKEILSVGLVGQAYICPAVVKKIQQSLYAGIFVKKNGKFVCLYKARRFDLERNPIFLSEKGVKDMMKKVFSNVEISLGQLSDGKQKYIAWQVMTDKGRYFIPWHNGLLCPEDETLTFEEKNFEEVRRTYSMLRFQKTTNTEYKVLCA